MQTLTIPVNTPMLLEIWPVWLRWQAPVVEAAPRSRRPYRRAREKRLARQLLREWGVA